MSSRPAVRRRSLLVGAAGAAAVAALPSVARASAGAATGLPLLEPLPAGAPDRRLFAPEEQRFAGYLAILAPMCNDIEDTDPATYGFIRGGWWRSPAQPYNSRVQEHVYTLSWMYANARRWNPYHRDPALLGRLDAALQHYLRLQNPDGSWPEYRPGERGKASSGFGLGYLAKTLANLRQARALPDRRAELEAALRLGMTWYLDPANRVVWDQPFSYTNQAVAGLAGSALALTLSPDDALAERLRERLEFTAREAQSPAGFFYDPRGFDVNYNFEVMLPEMAEIYAITRSPLMVSMARKFTDWFGLNLLREPDGSGWLTYYAVSARTATAYYDDVVADPDRTNLGSLFVPMIPQLGAFFTSAEGRAATRAAWAADPAPVPPLAKQNTSPRIIAHVGYGEAFPTERAKAAAIEHVPYLRFSDFVDLRRDIAENQDYLYVRTRGLYLGGFFGSRAGSVVKSGTGFLWHPAAGTLIHAQQTSTGAWGTVRSNGQPDAAGNLVVDEYRIGDVAFAGGRRAAAGLPVRVHYRTPDSVPASLAVSTALTITPDAVLRSVRAASPAVEQVPLVLLPEDRVAFTDGTTAPYGETRSATATGLVMRRGDATLTISWGAARTARLESSNRTYFRAGRHRVHVLRVPHDGALEVTYRAG